MPRKLNPLILLAIAAISSALFAPEAANAAEVEARSQSSDVPYHHWAYWALEKLAAAGLLGDDGPRGYFGGPRLLTRYQFAVITARIWEKLPAELYPEKERPRQPGELITLNRQIAALRVGSQPDISNPEVRTALEALRREFRAEIARLGYQPRRLD